MAQNNPPNPFADLAKMFEQFKVPGVDMTAIVDARRKDVEALTQSLHLFGVDLGQPHGRFELGGRLFKCGRHLAARTAPGGPEVDQYRDVVAPDMALERRRVQRRRVRGEKRLVATTAVGRILQVGCGHPICRVAVRANNMCGIGHGFFQQHGVG